MINLAIHTQMLEITQSLNTALKKACENFENLDELQEILDKREELIKKLLQTSKPSTEMSKKILLIEEDNLKLFQQLIENTSNEIENIKQTNKLLKEYKNSSPDSGLDITK
ncbi:MAG: hypothetical protein PHX21_06685 [bacterium]|nr:hypothetical protein [bacterium]